MRSFLPRPILLVAQTILQTRDLIPILRRLYFRVLIFLTQFFKAFLQGTTPFKFQTGNRERPLTGKSGKRSCAENDIQFYQQGRIADSSRKPPVGKGDSRVSGARGVSPLYGATATQKPERQFRRGLAERTYSFPRKEYRSAPVKGEQKSLIGFETFLEQTDYILLSPSKMKAAPYAAPLVFRDNSTAPSGLDLGPNALCDHNQAPVVVRNAGKQFSGATDKCQIAGARGKIHVRFKHPAFQDEVRKLLEALRRIDF